jgi:hypothetical protein
VGRQCAGQGQGEGGKENTRSRKRVEAFYRAPPHFPALAVFVVLCCIVPPIRAHGHHPRCPRAPLLFSFFSTSCPPPCFFDIWAHTVLFRLGRGCFLIRAARFMANGAENGNSSPGLEAVAWTYHSLEFINSCPLPFHPIYARLMVSSRG